jgi:hypothetical protein
MSLEQIFYVSQSVAAIAVVSSIIYLAQQVRQAERIQRAMMQQGRADRVSQLTLAVADPQLARVFRMGITGDSLLTRDEFLQWMLMARAAFLSAEDSFLQHKSGLLDESAFDSFVAGVRRFFAAPGYRAAWRLSSNQYGSEFRKFVNSIIDQTSVASEPDDFAEWQKLVQSEKRLIVDPMTVSSPKPGG